MTTVIIDYESGNLHSALKSFQRIAHECEGGEVIITRKPADVRNASRIVLPGVGSFGDCRRGLKAIDDLFTAIEERVKAGVAFLGICVGLQMMASYGYERGHYRGFDWIKGRVIKLTPDDSRLKIPHIGWNDLNIHRQHPLLKGINSGDHAYFVHSYHLVPDNCTDIVATSDYGGAVNAIIACDNMVGTQFHPEKSQKTGLRLIKNFLYWSP